MGKDKGEEREQSMSDRRNHFPSPHIVLGLNMSKNKFQDIQLIVLYEILVKKPEVFILQARKYGSRAAMTLTSKHFKGRSFINRVKFGLHVYKTQIFIRVHF